MPPKADYWQYFVVQGVLAICQLPGCSNPNVSLGALPKAGEKKRWWEQNEAGFLSKGAAGKALVALAKRWMTAVALPLNPILFHQVSHTSRHFQGCRKVVQCSRVDNGREKKQTFTQVCWQAAFPPWGLPVGYLQTFLEVENHDLCRFMNNYVMEIY